MGTLNLTILNHALKEAYSIAALPERDIKKYRLICRYSEKVSKRLLEQKDQLRKEGQKLLEILILKIYSNPNPFYSMIEKKDWELGGIYKPSNLKSKQRENNDMK